MRELLVPPSETAFKELFPQRLDSRADDSAAVFVQNASGDHRRAVDSQVQAIQRPAGGNPDPLLPQLVAGRRDTDLVIPDRRVLDDKRAVEAGEGRDVLALAGRDRHLGASDRDAPPPRKHPPAQLDRLGRPGRAGGRPAGLRTHQARRRENRSCKNASPHVRTISLHFSPPDGRSTRYDRHDFVALACRARRTVQVRLRAPSGSRLVLAALSPTSSRHVVRHAG